MECFTNNIVSEYLFEHEHLMPAQNGLDTANNEPNQFKIDQGLVLACSILTRQKLDIWEKHKFSAHLQRSGNFG